MASFLDKLISKAQKIFDKLNGASLSQDSNVPVGERYVTAGLPELIRQSSADGSVLLKNDGVLPLKSSDKVAVFGRCQVDYFYVGYGSGGDVKPPYKVSFLLMGSWRRYTRSGAQKKRTCHLTVGGGIGR